MNDLSKASVFWRSVGEDSENQRIDNYLAKVLKGVPKSHIYRILRSGEVRVNSKRVDPNYRLKIGDKLRIPPVRTARPTRQGAASRSNLLLEVLFEDDVLLAINKPSGVAVHGGSGISSGIIELLRVRKPKPRFLELVHRLEEMAAEKKVKPSQLALAWVLAQGKDIVPIPGTKRRKYLEENVAAVEIQLTREELRRIDEIAPRGVAAGPRYPEAMMNSVNR